MAAAALVAAAAIAVAGCGATPAPVAAAHTPAAASKDCPLPEVGFDCDFQRRIAAVQDYLATRPGTTGVVLHDQQTGAVWHNDHATDPTWTASTIKLAMVVDLLTRDHKGEITLTDDDRALIQAMLHSSDDDAADTLWYRYAGDDHMTFNENFAQYGLTSLEPQKGYTDFYPYWGFQKCTPEDLDRLIHYVLTDLPEPDRAYLLGEMRAVAPNQQWGVWGAGPAAAPGNKNGWSEEDTGWVMNSIGFVGPGERYTLAEMNNLAGEGDYDAGRETVTHVAELLFAGRF
jgi:hypothetical protein